MFSTVMVQEVGRSPYARLTQRLPVLQDMTSIDQFLARLDQGSVPYAILDLAFQREDGVARIMLDHEFRSDWIGRRLDLDFALHEIAEVSCLLSSRAKQKPV